MGNPKYHPKPENKANRNLKICLVVSSLFIVIVATIILTLSLTIFKPKNPDVSVYPAGLENLQLFSPNSTITPLGMVITVVNPNYGCFKSKNASGYLTYNDTIIAEVSIGTISFPARRMTNVSTTADIMSGKLISNPDFFKDIEDGSLNATAKATLSGKVYMLKVFKLKAKVDISCDISINFTSLGSDSSCISKIKI